MQSRTFTYKTAGDLEIKLDVHRPADEQMRPVAVWIHGGALVMGHREWIGRMKQVLTGAGYVVASIDYRLAPETKLPVILDDVADAIRWIREEGPRRFYGDTREIAVMGGSAGGYLTLTCGYRIEPRPSVLVAFWGYGDLIGDWYSTPSPHARHRQIQMSEQEAYRQVGGSAISDERTRKRNGEAFYQYCRQHGIWPRAVTGWDPRSEQEKFFPFMPLKNVTKDYAPTMLIHGTRDTDVPYEQSVLMARQFEQHGVPHELVSIGGGEHGLEDADPAAVDAAYASALRFVQRYSSD
jgi:acetyl esterase/lipase